MQKYIEYKIEDFAGDDYFVKWCLDPTTENEIFWMEWIKDNPSKKEIIFEAKEMVMDLYDIQYKDSYTDFSKEIWSKVNQNINDIDSKDEPIIVPFYRNTAIVKKAMSIAALFALAVITFVLYNNLNQKESSEWVNNYNESNHNEIIKLQDGSIVILEPFSSLKYPKNFLKDKRQVVLKGEATFDIKRNELSPFLVYANQTVTKVLGTSFRITAFEGQESVKVDVISGKVAVYANVGMKPSNKKTKKIIINTDERIELPEFNKKLEVTPNQTVIFNLKEAEMIKTVAEKPKILVDKDNIAQFSFDDEPVTKVFEALEYTYGIKMIFDKMKLKNCTITTKLDDEPLLQKVAIICTALDLEFKEENANIMISGNGCR